MRRGVGQTSLAIVSSFMGTGGASHHAGDTGNHLGAKDSFGRITKKMKDYHLSSPPVVSHLVCIFFLP